MPVSVEDVRADIVPDPGQAQPAREQAGGKPLDMDKVTRELRRSGERHARLLAD